MGKYLLKYDRRWACWLFPYVRSTDANKENVDNFASQLLQKEISTVYVTQATHCKYSVSDDVYYTFLPIITSGGKRKQHEERGTLQL